MDHRKPMDAPAAAAMAIGSIVWQQPEVGGFAIGVGHPPVGIPIKRISRYFRADPVDMYTPCFNLSTIWATLSERTGECLWVPKNESPFCFEIF